MRLDDGIMSCNNKRIDTFQEAMALQESVYVWSDYLRVPSVHAIELIPSAASKTTENICR